MCIDQIRRACRVCGYNIPVGTTWHGERIEYHEWLEKYGNICVYCHAHEKYIAEKPRKGLRRRKRR